MPSDLSSDLSDPPRFPVPLQNLPLRKPHKTSHYSSERRRKDRSNRDLIEHLALEERAREAKELQKLIFNVNEQVHRERQRADEAERQLIQAVSELQKLNNDRILAQEDALKLDRDLNSCKLELDAAQKEIYRAQDLLGTIDSRRHRAEEEAARARTTARKLREEQMVYLAREEGRRLGMQEGLDRGKDLGFREGRAKGFEQVNSSRGDEDRNPELEDDSLELVLPPQGVRIGDSSSSSSQRTARKSRGSAREKPPPEPPLSVTAPSSSSSRRASRAEATQSFEPPKVYHPFADIHPVPVHNRPPSPSHPEVYYPPDGYVPETGADDRIFLPPPHDLSRPPPIPEDSPASSVVRLAPEDAPPLRIPARASHSTQGSIGYGGPYNVIRERQNPQPQNLRRKRRGSSPDSNSSAYSTSLSQFDLVNNPSEDRPSPLSVIQEVLSTQASPNPGRSLSSLNASTASLPQVSVVAPTPGSSTNPLPNLNQRARRQTMYRRSSTSSSSDSMTDTRSKKSKSKKSMSSMNKNDHQESSSSNSSVFDIIVEPPSRPASSTHRSTEPASHAFGAFLSPADADRPMPLPREPPPSIPGPALTGRGPVVLPDGQLPLGFVPSPQGFTPTTGSSPLPPSNGPPMMPGGFEEPPVIPYVNTRPKRHETNSQAAGGGSNRREDVVIPHKSVRDMYGPADSEDEEVSSRLSGDTDLDTPPAKHANIKATPRSGFMYM